ncbi:hypothetical protein PQX77_017471 [Marasmius sp. AFHP31]|nr:hypothetical protein PQX77_017471 [Marasmius sp. AFHP31]
MSASFFGGPGMTIQGNLRLLRYEDGSEILVSGDSVVDGDEPMEDIRIFGRNHVVNTGNGCECIPLIWVDVNPLDDLLWCSKDHFSRAEGAELDSESGRTTSGHSPDDSGNSARRASYKMSLINGDLHVTTAGYDSHRNSIGPQGSQGGGPNYSGLSNSFRAPGQRGNPHPTSRSYSMSNHPSNHYDSPGPTQLDSSSNPFMIRQAMSGQATTPQQMGRNRRYPILQLANNQSYSSQAPAQDTTTSIVEIGTEDDDAEVESEQLEQSNDEGKGEGGSSSTTSVSGPARTAH